MHEPGNDIHDEGATALAPTLAQMTRLKELDLAGKYVIGSWPWATVCDDLHGQHPLLRRWCLVVWTCIPLS